ncbi:acyl carrier protein [Aliiroseovarius marinus]|uniref:acyl carrier protein n=1 Tax=Aliiroseovarius marinus TaxID=2500159 RepID=UPI002494E7D2|nr:acyl carrier protein [Aliiroseovarius marinus]
MTSDAPHTPDSLMPIILAAFQVCFPGQEITPEEDFFNLGGDSLKAQEFCLALEQHLSGEIHPSLLFEASSPDEIAEFLASTLPAA